LTERKKREKFLSFLFLFPMRKLAALLSFSLLLVAAPTAIKKVSAVSAGDVLINEIAWAGSSSSSADEFVELKNATGAEIDLTGWTLEGAGVSGSTLSLSGSIPAGGFFLLANYAADNSSSALAIEPSLVNGDLSLPNNQLQLILKDGDGATIDTADDGSGDPLAGYSETGDLIKKSMARRASGSDGTAAASWATSSAAANLDSGVADLATPGAENFPGSTDLSAVLLPGVALSFDPASAEANEGTAAATTFKIDFDAELTSFPEGLAFDAKIALVSGTFPAGATVVVGDGTTTSSAFPLEGKDGFWLGEAFAGTLGLGDLSEQTQNSSFSLSFDGLPAGEISLDGFAVVAEEGQNFNEVLAGTVGEGAQVLADTLSGGTFALTVNSVIALGEVSSSATATSAELAFTLSEDGFAKVDFGEEGGTLDSSTGWDSSAGTAKSFLLENLSCGKTYAFRAAAGKTSGIEEVSAEGSFETGACLQLDGTTMTRRFAKADDSFENGWQWELLLTSFDATETSLRLAFEDWENGGNSFSAADRMQFAVSTDLAGWDSPDWKTVTATEFENAAAVAADLDEDSSKEGRQFRVRVEVKIPTTAAPGNWSSSYRLRLE
jgi:hypothetical protein